MKKLKTGDQVLAEGHYVRLVDRQSYEFVSRINSRGVVVIWAETKDQELILVEQFRPACDAAVIEFPAGLVGDEADFKDESLIEAAKRELEEETGYRANTMEALVTAPVSAGLSDEKITVFKADDLEKVGPGGGVEGEGITVHVVPKKDLQLKFRDWQNQGKLIDLKLFLALHHV